MIETQSLVGASSLSWHLTGVGTSIELVDVAQDAAYQSHTGRLTGLWFLPKLAQGLNTNNNNNNNVM